MVMNSDANVIKGSLTPLQGGFSHRPKVRPSNRPKMHKLKIPIDQRSYRLEGDGLKVRVITSVFRTGSN